MDIVKIVITGIICAAVYSLMKQIRPELAPFTALAGIALTGAVLLTKLGEITDAAGEITALAGLSGENIGIIIKCVTICIITRLGADICNDNSCTAVGDAVELSGKIGAAVVALPMIKAAARVALGLIS